MLNKQSTLPLQHALFNAMQMPLLSVRRKSRIAFNSDQLSTAAKAYRSYCLAHGYGRASPRLAVLTSPSATSGPKHRFTSPMGHSQPIQQQPVMPGQWPRKSMRVSLDAEVSLRRSGKLTYRVRIFDASRHGCKVEFIERPTLSERAWIKFDGLEPLEATVCWMNGFATGVQFEKPINPAVFDGLIERLKAHRCGSGR